MEALDSPAPNWKPKTKSAKVIALLSRGKGAGMNDICTAIKWKPHSVPAFLCGLRKKGFAIVREQRGDEGTVYRIAEQPVKKGKTGKA